MPLESMIVANVASMIVFRLLCPAEWSLDLYPSSGRLKMWGGAEWGFIRGGQNGVLSYGALVCQLRYQLLRELTELRWLYRTTGD
jgi:hypothetical protein